MSEPNDDLTRSAPKPSPEDGAAHRAGNNLPAYGKDDEQDYVDRSVIDFDPDDGLYAGTAVDGSTNIPGDHPDLDERGVEYDVEPLDDQKDESTAPGSDGSTSTGRHRPQPGPGH